MPPLFYQNFGFRSPPFSLRKEHTPYGNFFNFRNFARVVRFDHPISERGRTLFPTCSYQIVDPNPPKDHVPIHNTRYVKFAFS